MSAHRSASPARSDASRSSSADFDFDFMRGKLPFLSSSTPPPTTAKYTRRALGGHGPLQGPEEVQVRLVGGHPLWGHLLYPAAIALSRYLETHAPSLLHSSPNDSISDPKGKGKAEPKRIIELGAGGGLPALIAALESDPLTKVVISDYPDQDLVDNLQHNIALNGLREDKIQAKGFAWGHSVASLIEGVWGGDQGEREEKFDVVLLSDVVFNHSQHEALLESCHALLKPAPIASGCSSASSTSSLPVRPIDLTPPELDLHSPLVLCFFSHHRPTDILIKADNGLIELAKTKGWIVTKVWEDLHAGPAFPEDKGDLAIRSTVHGYAFTRPSPSPTATSTQEA